MMQSKWRMPAGAASSALLLALCIQRTVSFQTQSSLAIPTRLHPQTSPITRAAANIPLFASSSNDVDDDNNTKETKNDDGPDLLQPYLPAIDPKYSVKGPIGEGKFTISRSGPPTAAELSNEQMLQIVKIQCSDLEVNTLVWKCLGYRFHEETWSPTEVFPKWKERFPDPPDFIGMQRVYSREVDVPSLRSNQALVRSVPQDNKQSLKTHLKPLGWTGYQYKELTPNKTRRAQCANWLIFYREELFGYTVEELKERRRLKKEAETVEAKRLEEEEGEKSDEWKLPVKEVY
eukprot:CAMPEP_0201865822 /NCGR_PEP_ID=MMETSP0902-20130614/610_1 /ASSEMBLY_ACC=CAM_ASM_000551 /TAXON_ID=420261 /ORGANISM="Thalassiosira antarctica, Strain CCMP982" /LENGTH=289 /DNA_ID=CAMNT_0048390675 /DNA_START=37 /DNA_END=906 /DNA_ORIENTATION=-